MISGTNSTPSLQASLTGAGTEAKASQAREAQDRFLALLVAQMKNQDPLNPLDNAQFTTQLAQISAVNGIEQLNATLNSLRGDVGGLNALGSVALAGRQVLVNGDSIELANGQAAGGFELAQAADRVTLTLVDGSGLAVHRVELGGQSAGAHVFAWDGIADSGAAAAPGRYRVQLQAYAQGREVPATALAVARVEGVNRGADGFTLNVGALGTRNFADVRQVM
jgi:flagellar basal-body rod modification protein FlgD